MQNTQYTEPPQTHTQTHTQTHLHTHRHKHTHTEPHMNHERACGGSSEAVGSSTMANYNNLGSNYRPSLFITNSSLSCSALRTYMLQNKPFKRQVMEALLGKTNGELCRGKKGIQCICFVGGCGCERAVACVCVFKHGHKLST